VYEVVAVDDDMSKLIVEKPDSTALKEMSKKKKFSTLWENAIRKMLTRITTEEEVLRVAHPDPMFNEPVHLRKTTEPEGKKKGKKTLDRVAIE
jgi:hypothetical protein